MSLEVPYGYIHGQRAQPSEPASKGEIQVFKPSQVQQEISDFRAAHKSSDVDFAPGSLHHTIGSGPMQAASGQDVARILDSRFIHYYGTDNISGIVGTSYVLGTPIAGFTFTAPASGLILVQIQANLEMANNTFFMLLGFQIRQGSTLGSGTVVHGSTTAEVDEFALSAGPNVTASGPERDYTCQFHPRTLTAGSPYNIHTVHRVTGGTGQIFSRQVMVFPQF